MAIYRCTSPFSTRTNGVPRVVASGELVSEEDPVYKGREKHFEPVETYVDRIADKRAVPGTTVEQATAAPGEKRDVPVRQSRKPRKRTTPKPEGRQDETDAV